MSASPAMYFPRTRSGGSPAFAGIVVGSGWNYAVSSVFTWKQK
jgi:hypothetical protein